mmetsp:Transcript_6508/g.14870  ORF Transcript_6508/g.14870 Transcript_6508/m.14870 type:complete len:219 (+) Transcript_6508:360-1016(+)
MLSEGIAPHPQRCQRNGPQPQRQQGPLQAQRSPAADLVRAAHGGRAALGADVAAARLGAQAAQHLHSPSLRSPSTPRLPSTVLAGRRPDSRVWGVREMRGDRYRLRSRAAPGTTRTCTRIDTHTCSPTIDSTCSNDGAAGYVTWRPLRERRWVDAGVATGGVRDVQVQRPAPLQPQWRGRRRCVPHLTAASTPQCRQLQGTVVALQPRLIPETARNTS